LAIEKPVLSPQRVAQISVFSFFGIKFNFSLIKSDTNFYCVKTSSGRVVEQSVSYEITEKYRREKVFFTKILAYTYLPFCCINVHASTVHAVSTAE